MKLQTHIPILDKLEVSETTVLLGTAIVIGAGTGLGAVGFIKLIAWIQDLFFNGGERIFSFMGRGLIILIPMIGGLLAGPIISFFAKEAKGHGVPEVMQAIALKGGRIRPRVVVAKIAASSICIGSGGSAGREGPIVQVGAALGSTIGQWLRLSDTRIRNLVACGAAAGIAATFNAPIAGVVFAMEIILGELHLGDLGNVVISAVMASTIARIFLGQDPAFIIPKYGMQTPWEVILYALLGALTAVAAVGFIRLLYWFEDLFDNWKFPDALKPAVGGLLLGLLAFAYPIALGSGLLPADQVGLGLPIANNFPQIFGAGFEVIDNALLGRLPILLLLVLAVLKPLATSLTLGSGNSGGVFAPSLFSGAVLGGAFGQVMTLLFPGQTASPGAFAVVGMAAMFAGAARAPFTAILIVFEMTDDIRIIIPLMAAVIISLIVSDRLMHDSIYTLKLTRRGIHLRSGHDLDVMEAVRVEEVMVQEPETVSTETPILELAEKFIDTGRHGFPVLDQNGKLFGMVSLEDYRQALAHDGRRMELMQVKDIATRSVVSVNPSETVGMALRRMAPRDISRLPVVDPKDPHTLLGMVRRNDIVRAYEMGVTRRDDIRLQISQQRIEELAGLETIEIRVEPCSTCDASRMSDIPWPRECIVAAIRRKNRIMIPHGDAVLEAGDIVVLVSEGKSLDEVRQLCAPQKEEKAA
jgi:CIC family chloride channel protein